MWPQFTQVPPTCHNIWVTSARPYTPFKIWFRKSQELKQKLLAGAENGRPTKPWHGEQYGIAQNLCRERKKCLRGKRCLQKIFGMGGKKEDRVWLLQDQDLWGMQEGGRSHTQSFTQEYTRSLSNKDSGVLLGAPNIEATRTGRLWSQLLTMNPNCNTGYIPIIFSYLKTEGSGYFLLLPANKPMTWKQKYLKMAFCNLLFLHISCTLAQESQRFQ